MALGTLLVELGINSGAFISGVDKATYKAKQGAVEIGNAFRGIGTALTEMTAEMGNFGAIIGQSLGTLGRVMGQVTREMGSMNGAAGALKFTAVGFAAIAAASATAGAAMVGIAVHAAEGAARLHELSQATGVAVKDLSGLSIIGKLVGVDIEVLSKGLERLDRTAMAAAANPNKAANAYRTLGISVTDSTGHLKSTVNIFGEISDKFSTMEDGATKTALAMQIFGRAGANLIPVLNQGSAVMKYWIEYGTKVGAVLSGEAAEGAHNFENQMTKLSLISEGVQNKLMAALLPAIDHVIVAFTTFAEKGNTIRDMGLLAGRAIVSLSGIVFEAAYAWDWWGSKLDVWQAKMEKAGNWLSRHTQSAKEQAGYALNHANDQALDKTIADAEKRIQAANDHLAIELADLASSTIASAVPGAKEQKDKNTPPIAPIEKFGTFRPPSSAGQDFITKTEEATKSQLAMSDAIGQSTAALTLNDAAQRANSAVTAEINKLLTESKKIDAEIAGATGPAAAEKKKVLKATQDGLTQQITLLENYREGAIAAYSVDAVAKFAEALGKSSAAQNEADSEAIASQKELAAAYQVGGNALTNAQIDVKLEGQRKTAETLRTEIALLSKDSSVYTDELARLTADLNQINGAMEKHRQNLIDEHAATIATSEAHLNLQATYNTELQDLNDMLAVALKNKDVMTATIIETKKYNDALKLRLDTGRALFEADNKEMLAKAQLISQQQAENAQIDAAAIKVGGLHNTVVATLNDLADRGQNFWADFANAGKAAVDGLNGQLASLITTGKANFKQVAQSFADSMLKSSLQSLESKALGAFGFGGGQKLDGSSESTAIWTRTAKTGSQGGAVGGAIHSVVGGFLNKLGLGGLAQGTGAPDGTQSNPLYVMDASGGGGLFGGSSGGSDGGGGILGIIGSIFGGKREGGGDVTPGKAYIVGEKHPEFFMPGKSGTIAPSLKAGGSTTNVAVHFHGLTDVDSFKKNSTQIAAMFHRQASIAAARNS